MFGSYLALRVMRLHQARDAAEVQVQPVFCEERRGLLGKRQPAIRAIKERGHLAEVALESSRRNQLQHPRWSIASVSEGVRDATRLENSGSLLGDQNALAERAGVERLTVYRHFPSERDLLHACQQHFRAQHPLPDPALWMSIGGAEARLRMALVALYAYYRDTEAMTANILHDAQILPELASILTGREAYVAMVQQQLADAWQISEERRPLLVAAVGHTLDFETWRSLAPRQQLSDEQAVDMMVTLVRSVATGDIGAQEPL